MIRGLRTFAASVDGSLLDDATWASRHRRISAWGWTLTVVALLDAVVSPESTVQWLFAPAMAALMAFAARELAGRRSRQAAVAATLVAAQVYLSRYVGNVTGLGAIVVIVLSFYQDWLALLLPCLAALALLLVAVVDPTAVAAHRGFGVEDPLTGMGFRASSIVLAAALAIAVWRSGTQMARDQLTGVLSRAGAERILDREIGRGRAPTAWVCDIDSFSAVNAELGPAAGDSVLRHTASELRAAACSLPGASLCARLDSDTFLVATHDRAEASAIESFATRIQHGIGVSAHGIAGYEVPIRLSVGAATAIPSESASGLIGAAQRNMRDAKGRGTHRVVIDQRDDRSARARMPMLMSELYRACERGELELYYQPIVSLADGAPAGAEALVRWNHPERGLLFPAAFLPGAEQDSALMAEVSATLGEQFMRTVSDLVARRGTDWLSYGYSLNLAAIRLRDPMLVATMTEHLAATGRSHAEHRIALEVTEGALMDIEHGVPEVLARLERLGFRIALDDFGTGHSSLAHLRDFPLDTVKVDKTFVRAMHRSPLDDAVVKAVADIASASGLTVIAEGVETALQRDALMAIKPDMLAQGWLYAPALAAAEFEQWVLDRKAVAVA